MRSHGITEDDLFSFLISVKENDRGYRKVLSSMCTLPHPVAVRAMNLFIESNLGDPGLFEGAASLEALLVERIGALMHLPGACGYATSGGTESNLQALRMARRNAGVRSPNVVVPESAHFSFEKACEILSLEMRVAPASDGYRMDADATADLMDKNTVALVGVAGTTEYGAVDPIEALAEIASDRDTAFHVDAAFGGLVLPFLPDAPVFDFQLEGVTSISVDPHKMGMSTIPVGCLLTRDPSMLCSLSVDTPYLTVKQEFTLAGTRSGGAVAGALAVIEHLGQDGFTDIVRECMANHHRLIDGMAALGYPVIGSPEVNVASFDCPETPDGWQVSRTRHGHMRIVCMPHITTTIIEEFLKDMADMHV